MKKLTSLFLACLLAGITLSSCGSGAEKAATVDSSAVKKDSVAPVKVDSVTIVDSGTGKPIVPPKS